MNISTYEEILSLAKGYKTIPVSCQILSDIKTPIQVLRSLKAISSHCYMLESLEDSSKWGRYTFLGYDPKLEFTCLNGVIKINGETIAKNDNPKKYIKNIIEENKSPKLDYLPTFTGGLVGYFSYDYIKYNEPSLKLVANDDENFNDVDLMLFDKVIAFDNLKQKIFLIINIKTDNLKQNYDTAVSELKKMADIIQNGVLAKQEPLKIKSEFRYLFTKQQYCDMVNKTKTYIKNGDIFQAVLSNRIDVDVEGSLLDTYRILRTTNPSPYMFYFCSKDIEIAGSSPETLVKLDNGILHTFPLAGTRPRGKTQEEDLQLEKDLLSDKKELAEHNMLVDLGRNDLGKISKFGSVTVEKYMSIERFSHVMHIGSTVRGEIKDEKSAIDGIDTVLPAGTLSGAPKIRACQIINELEQNKRGIYGGAIGYIDFSGNMDTCISIRIAFKKNNKVFIRSGAGIVADSVPEKEYQECVNKAQAVVNALKLSAEKNFSGGKVDFINR
ncbi:MAG: anthranilate synthase component I [Elusimicrobia bacterium]|jgi:anthranilate synthase component 1|nr:anthranilate synthase component I [Elusimicrobiota bacterium]